MQHLPSEAPNLFGNERLWGENKGNSRPKKATFLQSSVYSQRRSFILNGWEILDHILFRWSGRKTRISLEQEISVKKLEEEEAPQSWSPWDNRGRMMEQNLLKVTSSLTGCQHLHHASHPQTNCDYKHNGRAQAVFAFTFYEKWMHVNINVTAQ